MAEEPSNNTAVAESTNAPNATEQNTGQQQQAPQQQTGWQIFKSMMFRMLIMYAIMSWLRKPSAPGNESGSPAAGVTAPSSNIYQSGMKLDYYFYMSEFKEFNDFDNEESLLWSLEDLAYGDWEGGPNGDASYTFSTTFIPSENVKNNGSLYLHVFVVKAGKSPNPAEKGRYLKRATIYRSMQLNKFKKRRFHDSANLLTGATAAHPDLIQKNDSKTIEILSHWHPNLTVNIVQDHTPWTKGSVPAPLDEYIEFDDATGKYRPILYFNNYWNLNSDYVPVNDTTKNLTLNLQFYPLSMIRWQMYAAQSMRSKWYSSYLGEEFSESDEEQDSLKTTLVETNPYLLAMTIVVSIIHSVFEFLAFKNDIQFWRTRKSLEGLSVRSVFFNVFTSAIVLLYVIDNETNTVVRISVVIGLLIEIWKIPKACDVKFDYEQRWFAVIPRIVIADKATYTESDTKKYDKMAFKYLSWLLYPMLGCYAVYSLLYQEHRGWYSWILSMLYGFLLTFGFIMMTPQLFINYKLKSVAHLPWRMLTYKALNTFIDDIFAFVIKMPTLYRIGCLRDDVIFFIFLYQRYIYRIDPKRVNEFGTTGEMHEAHDSAPEQKEAIGDIAEEAVEKSTKEKKED